MVGLIFPPEARKQTPSATKLPSINLQTDDHGRVLNLYSYYELDGKRVKHGDHFELADRSIRWSKYKDGALIPGSGVDIMSGDGFESIDGESIRN